MGYVIPFRFSHYFCIVWINIHKPLIGQDTNLSNHTYFCCTSRFAVQQYDWISIYQTSTSKQSSHIKCHHYATFLERCMFSVTDHISLPHDHVTYSITFSDTWYNTASLLCLRINLYPSVVKQKITLLFNYALPEH